MEYSKDMVKAKQSGKRASNTKVNGKKICKTVKALRPKKMAHTFKDNFIMAKSKDMESTGGQTQVFTKASGIMTN